VVLGSSPSGPTEIESEVREPSAPVFRSYFFAERKKNIFKNYSILSSERTNMLTSP
jgi:hypothetical protein